jgi:hypothetical protein
MADDGSGVEVMVDLGGVYFQRCVPRSNYPRPGFVDVFRQADRPTTQDQIITGEAPRRRVPVRVFANLSEHNVAVELWAITLASAVPPAWSWRRGRRQRTRGFEVEFVGKPAE